MEARKSIALGMSGGVDSAVSAALLLRAGYEVTGVTCLFVDDEASRASAEDARAVCDRFGIAHMVHACSGVFEKIVVEPFVADYEAGLTPSPCVHCNAGCKIPMLMEAADELGCDYIATGHYARIARLRENDRFVVKGALDASKDQSYMLSMLSQEQLARLVLPLGGTTKVEVRLLAEELGLSVADKPESQDICFFDGDYTEFLSMRGVEDKPGDIVDGTGKVLGRHAGLFRYTIGQRKGIGIAAPQPYYVIGKRAETNELVVGFEDETRISQVRVANMNWQAFERLEEPLDCMVKLRYRSRKAACTVSPAGSARLDVEGAAIEVPAGESDEAAVSVAARSRKEEADGPVEADGVVIDLLSPQTTTAPGQFAVFYQGETVLGGGVIREAW